MKKWLFFFLMAVLALSLVACGGNDTTAETTTKAPVSTTAPTTTEPAVTTTEGKTVDTAPVAVNGVSDYVIVYDGSNPIIKSAVSGYVTKLKSKFGITITSKPIANVSEPYEHEILVGDLSEYRDSVKAVKESVGKGGDFAVSVKGDDVVLYATDDTNYLYLFTALVEVDGLKPANKSLTYSSDKDFYFQKSSLKDTNYAEYKGQKSKISQALVNDMFTYHETVTSTGSKLVYRMYVPSNYDPEKEYPLLVVLHGAGERGTNNTSQMTHMILSLFNQKNSLVDNAIVICPQCPNDNQWVDTPWANGNYSTDRVPESNELAAVVKLVEDLMETHSVDKNRVYAMGLSMGGFGTWDLLMRHGDLFAAGIPICGGGDHTKAKELAKIPIYTFHGSADPTVPASGTKMMATMIEKQNPADFHYEEFEGAGHGIWETVAQREDVIQWLFSRSMADRK